MLVQILVDNPNSWIFPYAKELVSLLRKQNHESQLILEASDVVSGDVLCLLGCEKIFKRLDLNTYNLVVHESNLPEGKGWSPLTWQILEGKNQIPVTLFEAKEEIDAGEIYSQEIIKLEGTELLPEIKDKQGVVTQKLIMNFIDKIPNVVGYPQKGNSTFYPKRTSRDSQLNPDKSIAEQFDQLRVCDNERYPAFFIIQNKKYIIKIYKEDDK